MVMMCIHDGWLQGIRPVFLAVEPPNLHSQDLIGALPELFRVFLTHKRGSVSVAMTFPMPVPFLSISAGDNYRGLVVFPVQLTVQPPLLPTAVKEDNRRFVAVPVSLAVAVPHRVLGVDKRGLVVVSVQISRAVPVLFA
jgi:hypothetical protein